MLHRCSGPGLRGEPRLTVSLGGGKVVADMSDLESTDDLRPEAIELELRRVFGVCGSCRICSKLCPAFTTLFAAIDRGADSGGGGLTAVTAEELTAVVDLCFDCRRCTWRCPFLPPHEAAVHVPWLVLAAKAARASQLGRTGGLQRLRRREQLAALGCATAPASNVLARWPARALTGRLLGWHPDAVWPAFAPTTWSRWLRREIRQRAWMPNAVDNVARVALFASCSANFFDLAAGQAVAQVLWHNFVELALPDHGCCGRPLLLAGDLDGARLAARANVAALLPWVDRGFEVVTPDPSCALMLREDYPRLLRSGDAQRLAEHTFEACEYLVRLRGEHKLRDDLRPTHITVRLHASCHAAAPRAGLKSLDLLRAVPGVEVEGVEECSAGGGTWGMRRESFALSAQWGAALVDAMGRNAANLYASDCPWARLRIGAGTGRLVRHPVEIVRDAYGLAPARG